MSTTNRCSQCRNLAAITALSFTLYAGLASGQALAPIAEPLQQAAARTTGSVSPNLFEQERSTLRGAGDSRESALPPATQQPAPSLPATAPSTRPVVPEASSGYTDALRQAGVIIDARNPTVVERVLPDSLAARAGLLRGDVITGISFSVQINRNGQAAQFNLNDPLRTASGATSTGKAR